MKALFIAGPLFFCSIPFVEISFLYGKHYSIVFVFQISDLVKSTLSISELSALHEKLSERLYSSKARILIYCRFCSMETMESSSQYLNSKIEVHGVNLYTSVIPYSFGKKNNQTETFRVLWLNYDCIPDNGILNQNS